MIVNHVEPTHSQLYEGIETARALVRRYRERVRRQAEERNSPDPFLLQQRD
jgi:hypothetical protein